MQGAKFRVLDTCMRITDLSGVADEELLASLRTVLRTETSAVAQVLVHLVEVEERRLHLEMACSSMFVFCTTRLGMSEGTANRRILAARLVRRFPRLLDSIASGRIHLSSVLRLHDLFTESNIDELVDAAVGKSKREVEELVARMAPKPPVAPSIRLVPEQRPLPSESPVLPPPVAVGEPARGDAKVSPLSEARYKLELTIDAETLERLEYARSLMRHKTPSGDLGVLLTEALEAVIETLEKRKLGKTSRPRTPRCANATRRSSPS